MAFGKRKINGFNASTSLSRKELFDLKGGVGTAGWDESEDVSGQETTPIYSSVGSSGWEEE